jgi:anti-sigma B factor antagonist
MSNDTPAHFKWHDSAGITIVEVVSREIRHPDPAQEFSRQLNALVEQEGRTRLLINFRKTHYLCSTAFAVLFNLAKKVEAAQGQLRICSMEPALLAGASILSLGKYVGIHSDEHSALASF